MRRSPRAILAIILCILPSLCRAAPAPSLHVQVIYGSRHPALISPPAPAAPKCVIVVVADRLEPSDLNRAPEALQELLATAAVGTMSSRAVHFGGDAAAFATIGAGSEVRVLKEDLPPNAESLYTFMPSMQAESERHGGGWPGSLGSDVPLYSGYTALIGNADTDIAGDAAAGLIAANSEGRISVNLEHAGELTDQQSWPYRRRSSPQVLAHTVLSLIAQHPGQKGLIVVQTGDSSRVDRWIWLNNRDPSEAYAARSHWMPVLLQQLTELLTPLVRAAREKGYLLCLVSPTPRRLPNGDPLPALTPAALWGPGFVPGPLVSPSARRPGLVLLSDLAPTFLQYLSLPIPQTMTGRPLHSPSSSQRQALWSFHQVRGIMSEASQAGRDYAYEEAAGMAFGSLVYLSLLTVAFISDDLLAGMRARMMQFLLLASCAGPAALIIPLAMPNHSRWGSLLLAGVLWLLFPLLIFRLRQDYWRLCAACAIPSAVVMLDCFTSGHFFRDVLMGRTPIGGAPLYGVGSAGAAVLTGAGLLALGVGVDIAGGKEHFRILAVVGAIGVALVLSLPSLGANPAGGLAAAAGAGVFGSLLLRKGKGQRTVLFSILGAGLSVILIPTVGALVSPGGWAGLWHIQGERLRQNWNPYPWLFLIFEFLPLCWLLLQDRQTIQKRLAALPGLRAALWSILPAIVLTNLLSENSFAAAGILVAYLSFPLLYLRLARLAVVREGATAYNNEQVPHKREAEH